MKLPKIKSTKQVGWGNKKFKSFCKQFKDEAYDIEINPRGIDLIEERNIKLWTIYQTIETNKKLVMATWILAISTIILSGITIYLQYFRN
jgi:hypothetical protein